MYSEKGSLRLHPDMKVFFCNFEPKYLDFVRLDLNGLPSNLPRNSLSIIENDIWDAEGGSSNPTW